MAKAILYVDGFNLYYQIEKTGYKWLNLRRLGETLLAGHDLIEVKYYTALVVNDPAGKRRQMLYWEALKSTKLVSIYQGFFKSEQSSMRPCGGGPKTCVEKTTEKQTDVNIAADMVNDAHKGKADIFALLSNDSDQQRPLQIVRSLGKKAFVINPNPLYSANVLNRNSDAKITIRPPVLQACQFPAKVPLGGGKEAILPPEWHWLDGADSTVPNSPL